MKDRVCRGTRLFTSIVVHCIGQAAPFKVTTGGAPEWEPPRIHQKIEAVGRHLSRADADLRRHPGPRGRHGRARLSQRKTFSRP